MSNDITPSTTSIHPAGVETEKVQTLRDSVIHSLNNYFSQVDVSDVSNLYQLVLSEVEAPLLQIVMKNARSNQSKASIMLGLNRGTLRKKLKQYDMLD